MNGAPRQPDLEFETDLPCYARAYLRFLLSGSRTTAIKFTRMHCKVGVLAEIDPNAKFIHLVRDPRLVTASYLFGKNQRNMRRFSSEDAFFERRSPRSAWSSHPFSEYVLQTPEYRHLQGCEDFARIRLLWKYTFQKTYEAGRSCFGENYLLLRHEDLRADPCRTVGLMYDFLGRAVPDRVIDRAKENVRIGSPQIYASGSRRWIEAVERLEMEDTLRVTGYSPDGC